MTTKTHRAVRKIAPILNRIEPFAIFVAYIGIGIMAAFAWFFPAKVSDNMSTQSAIIEALLMSVGALFGLWGHATKRELVEFYGICACAGGLFIFLCIVINSFVYEHQYNYGQIIGLILLAMGLVATHGFKLYHNITESWINAPAPLLQKIYETK